MLASKEKVKRNPAGVIDMVNHYRWRSASELSLPPLFK